MARGVKADAGILDLVTREIEIECLPTNIPAHIAVDVSELGIGDAIRVSELPAVEGVRIVDNPEKVVVHVAHPTREEEPVAAAEAAAEPAEPEVLKKGKVVTEEEGGGRRSPTRRTRRRRKRRSSLCTRSSASGIPGTNTRRRGTTPGFASWRRWRRRKESGSGRASVPRASAGEESGQTPVLLALPQTYMNASGEAVRALCQKHSVEPSELCVVVDDIDLPLGALRLRARGSAGGQKGLRSVIAHLGTTEFPRLRVGIRGERYSRERDLADYVLEPFAQGRARTVRRAASGGPSRPSGSG